MRRVRRDGRRHRPEAVKALQLPQDQHPYQDHLSPGNGKNLPETDPDAIQEPTKSLSAGEYLVKRVRSCEGKPNPRPNGNYQVADSSGNWHLPNKSRNVLSDEKVAANGRLAGQLVKQKDYALIARQMKSGFGDMDLNSRLRAKAEARDLLSQTGKLDLAKADRLAKGLGFGSVKQAVENPRALKGTIFFGGAGMGGTYIDDMKKAFEEAGIENIRAAGPEKWSTGNMFGNAAPVPFENNIDSEASDFSSFGEKGEQFNLVGYSYGGLQAAQGARDHADKGGKVDNLVLLGTSIEAGFLKSLQDHPNIAKVTVIDLSKQDDSIKASMNDTDVLKSVPCLF